MSRLALAFSSEEIMVFEDEPRESMLCWGGMLRWVVSWTRETELSGDLLGGGERDLEKEAPIRGRLGDLG